MPHELTPPLPSLPFPYQVIRNGTSLLVTVNGEERLAGTLTTGGPLTASVLYLGHVPEPVRRKRQAAEERGGQDQFKGSIQDVRVSDVGLTGR